MQYPISSFSDFQSNHPIMFSLFGEIKERGGLICGVFTRADMALTWLSVALMSGIEWIQLDGEQKKTSIQR